MALSSRFFIWAGITLLFFAFIFAVKAVLLPFIIGMLVAYFLDPAADRLETFGLSRGISTGIITISFFSFFIALLVVLIPFIAEQAGQFAAKLPTYIAQLEAAAQPYINEWRGFLPGEIQNIANGEPKEAIGGYASKALAGGGSVVDKLFKSGFAMLNLISLLVITPVVSFYLLKDWDNLTQRIDTLLPRAHADIIRKQFSRIDRTLAGFVRGQVNVCFLMALYNAIALSIIGLNFAILIGVISGMLILIPYIGTVLTALIAVGMAYVQFDTMEPVLVVAGIFVVGQMLEGYFLTPKLVGERVGLHPVWIIFGMLAGASLFGFVGIFIAVPVSAVIGVLIRFAVEQYVESDLYEVGKGKTESAPKRRATDKKPALRRNTSKKHLPKNSPQS